MPDKHATTHRPDCEQAHSFTATVCADPDCGLHIIAFRADDTPICELVLGQAQMQGLQDYIDEIILLKQQ